MKIPKFKALIFMKHHSERVPRKNLRLLNGKPLFHWILLTLNQSKYINEIIINTDSNEIADDARRNFNVTIHMRPEYLLKINSNEANQIIAYDINKTDGEFFIQTHSTNPLLKPETIDNAIEVFIKSNGYDSLFSVTSIRKRLYFSNGKPINHDPHKMIKTQDLPVIYEENSCIYIFTKSGFKKNDDRIGEHPKLYPINPQESIDIDTEEDFKMAESLMQNCLRKSE